MNSLKICIYLDSYERYTFFSRFVAAFEELGVEFAFCSNRLGVLKQLKARKWTALEIQRDDEFKIPLDLDLSNSLEALAYGLSSDCIDQLSSASYSFLEKYGKDFHCFFAWNGENVFSQCLRHFSQSRQDFQTLFFEISNLPGKLFVDPKGTNRSSSIFLDPSVLDDYLVDEKDFLKWSSNYIAEKKKQVSIPQVKISKPNYLAYIYDYLGFASGLYPKDTLLSIEKILSVFQSAPAKKSNFKLADNRDLKFYFLALQTSQDTQIKINSKVDNLQALKRAVDTANKDDQALVVKLHPAEKDKNIINDLESYALKHSAYLTTENSLSLIEAANKLFTINSSVGLEAIIWGLDTSFYGDTFYRHFQAKPEYLWAYVCSYLQDIEYFSQSSISSEQLKAVLSLVLLGGGASGKD